MSVVGAEVFHYSQLFLSQHMVGFGERQPLPPIFHFRVTDLIPYRYALGQDRVPSVDLVEVGGGLDGEGTERELLWDGGRGVVFSSYSDGAVIVFHFGYAFVIRFDYFCGLIASIARRL